MAALAELRGFLTDTLPSGWAEAVLQEDQPTLDALRDDLDNPAFVRALGREGWVAPHWPVECGGRGLDRDAAAAAMNILDEWNVPRTPRGSGLALAAPTILEWSSDETKQRLLPPLAAGEERWCQLFSEPGAGSDMASLATTAARDGDEWVVNGQKVWTTYGHESEFAMLLARTDPTAPKHCGITYFGLDMRQPGVEVRALINMAGDREFNEVFLTDARVPDLYRISPVGDGWGASLTTLGAERHALSGTKQKKRKASDEILGGKPIEEIVSLAQRLGLADHPVWRDRLMVEWSKARVLRLTTQRARDRRASGHPGGPEGSITKIAKASSNQTIQVLAMDMLGAAGQAWGEASDTPDFVHEFLRTRANSIEGGTSEIQRNIVGERVLGLGREPDAFKGQPWKDIPRT